MAAQKLFKGEDVRGSSQLACATMSTTMWYLQAVCFVAFVMHPTPGTSFVFPWCTAKDCSKINSYVNTLNTSVFRLHHSLEQQQQLQQKQQEKINAQLATLKETAEQQQNQQQQNKLATLSQTVDELTTEADRFNSRIINWQH